jgi:hypothetical protein
MASSDSVSANSPRTGSPAAVRWRVPGAAGERAAARPAPVVRRHARHLAAAPRPRARARRHSGADRASPDGSRRSPPRGSTATVRCRRVPLARLLSRRSGTPRAPQVRAQARGVGIGLGATDAGRGGPPGDLLVGGRKPRVDARDGAPVGFIGARGIEVAAALRQRSRRPRRRRVRSTPRAPRPAH